MQHSAMQPARSAKRSSQRTTTLSSVPSAERRTIATATARRTLHQRGAAPYGKSWESVQEAEKEKEERSTTASALRCPKCSTINPPDSVFCQICGTKLEENR